ncbi:hypothetical protein CF319_g7551 [Tilletia indica]|nr:hypothetical protein CF319_g7551 [Tilletia indica]
MLKGSGSPYRSVRILVLEECVRVIDAMAEERWQLPEGYWALAEAVEELIRAMRMGKTTVQAGSARIITIDPEERAEKCGAHPVAANGTYCGLCWRWNPTGSRANQKQKASWRWNGAATEGWTKEAKFLPCCHNCLYRWMKMPVSSIQIQEPDELPKALASLRQPMPDPDRDLVRWQGRQLLDDDEDMEVYWRDLRAGGQDGG